METESRCNGLSRRGGISGTFRRFRLQGSKLRRFRTGSALTMPRKNIRDLFARFVRRWISGANCPTRRLLHHWRHFQFSSLQPFFCQVEAVEVAIWLTEVAPFGPGDAAKPILAHLANANAEANPGLNLLALKLATGAGKTTVMAMLIAWQTLNAIQHPEHRCLSFCAAPALR